jgi:hypothetical protein
MAVVMNQDFAGVSRKDVEELTNRMGSARAPRQASSHMWRLTPPEVYMSSTSGRAKRTFRGSLRSD